MEEQATAGFCPFTRTRRGGQQDRDSFPELIFAGQCLLTLGDTLQVRIFLVLDLIHGSPDTAVSGPKMSCTRQVPVRTQAVGRSQRIGGTTTLVFTNHASFSRLPR